MIKAKMRVSGGPEQFKNAPANFDVSGFSIDATNKFVGIQILQGEVAELPLKRVGHLRGDGNEGIRKMLESPTNWGFHCIESFAV